jgi:CarD family transcriptional regulator
VPSKSASAKKPVQAAPTPEMETDAAATPAVQPAEMVAEQPVAEPPVAEPPAQVEPANDAGAPPVVAADPTPQHDEPAVAMVAAAQAAAAPVPAPSPAPAAAAAAAVPGGVPMGQRPPGMPGGRIMPPPRAMAKAEIFVEGDHVVYPTHGVGKVERIAVEEIAGHKLELIHITFEENRMTLRVPVTKARTAGLRKLATRKMFDEAMTVLRGRARIKRTMWSRRAQEYEAKINSGDPLAIAEVVRDLHRNAGQPDQSFSERQIYEAAMDRLAAELGALERIDKTAAAQKLADFLKTVDASGSKLKEPEITED